MLRLSKSPTSIRLKVAQEVSEFGHFGTDRRFGRRSAAYADWGPWHRVTLNHCQCRNHHEWKWTSEDGRPTRVTKGNPRCLYNQSVWVSRGERENVAYDDRRFDGSVRLRQNHHRCAACEGA